MGISSIAVLGYVANPIKKISRGKSLQNMEGSTTNSEMVNMTNDTNISKANEYMFDFVILRCIINIIVHRFISCSVYAVFLLMIL